MRGDLEKAPPTRLRPEKFTRVERRKIDGMVAADDKLFMAAMTEKGLYYHVTTEGGRRGLVVRHAAGQPYGFVHVASCPSPHAAKLLAEQLNASRYLP